MWTNLVWIPGCAAAAGPSGFSQWPLLCVFLAVSQQELLVIFPMKCLQMLTLARSVGRCNTSSATRDTVLTHLASCCLAFSQWNISTLRIAGVSRLLSYCFLSAQSCSYPPAQTAEWYIDQWHGSALSVQHLINKLHLCFYGTDTSVGPMSAHFISNSFWHISICSLLPGYFDKCKAGGGLNAYVPSRLWPRRSTRWRDPSRRQPSFWRPAPSPRCKWRSRWRRPSSGRRAAGTEVGKPSQPFPHRSSLSLLFPALSLYKNQFQYVGWPPRRAPCCWPSCFLLFPLFKLQKWGSVRASYFTTF